VKHLHKEAHKYDIGIYFEANGHGTVLFNKKAQENSHFFHLSQLLSQVVGDAIGNMLVIQSILSNICIEKWINMYEDLYTKQEKLYVSRDAFQTTNFGRFLVKPIGLQTIINCILHQYSGMHARAFLRPSGTEDIVRVYVESSNKDALNKITNSILKYAMDL
jgi:phosphoacetylglucosamine mutase